jgi:2-polyprenyl-3-methyl-5-hydroxy-6-metoxy-1,4-benzoquinol methylase
VAKQIKIPFTFRIKFSVTNIKGAEVFYLFQVLFYLKKFDYVLCCAIIHHILQACTFLEGCSQNTRNIKTKTKQMTIFIAQKCI